MIPTEPLLDCAVSIETVFAGNIKLSLSIVGKDMNVVRIGKKWCSGEVQSGKFFLTTLANVIL